MSFTIIIFKGGGDVGDCLVFQITFCASPNLRSPFSATIFSSSNLFIQPFWPDYRFSFCLFSTARLLWHDFLRTIILARLFLHDFLGTTVLARLFLHDFLGTTVLTRLFLARLPLAMRTGINPGKDCGNKMADSAFALITMDKMVVN